MLGVTHAWVNGGMAQWAALTMQERKVTFISYYFFKKYYSIKKQSQLNVI